MEGDRADRFGVARLGRVRPGTDDRMLGDLIAERDAINAKIETLRLEQERMTPQEYRSQLLQNMIGLAETEEAIEEREKELGLEN